MHDNHLLFGKLHHFWCHHVAVLELFVLLLFQSCHQLARWAFLEDSRLTRDSKRSF
jgi:hypothetical protein